MKQKSFRLRFKFFGSCSLKSMDFFIFVRLSSDLNFLKHVDCKSGRFFSLIRNRLLLQNCPGDKKPCRQTNHPHGHWGLPCVDGHYTFVTQLSLGVIQLLRGPNFTQSFDYLPPRVKILPTTYPLSCEPEQRWTDHLSTNLFLST